MLQLLSSKSIPGQVITPRLLRWVVQRGDHMIAVETTGVMLISFTPSQNADSIVMYTSAIDGDLVNPDQKFNLSGTVVTGTVENQEIHGMNVSERTPDRIVINFTIAEGGRYDLQLANLKNPKAPGIALWTLYTTMRGSLRDRLERKVGPPTWSRVTVDQTATTLRRKLFESQATTLKMAFSVSPVNVPAGNFLTIRAPFGYAFLDRTFKPGSGFPQVSDTLVYVKGLGGREPVVSADEVGRDYVIQIVAILQVGEVAHFTVRVDTPRTPQDLTAWLSK